MSTQGREFIILFLNTLDAIPFPVMSKLLRILFVRSVAARGSIHFSVSLLLLKIRISNVGQSQMALAMCCTPSSPILLLLKSILLMLSQIFICLMISFTQLSLILFPFKSNRSVCCAILKAYATTDSLPGFLKEARFNKDYCSCFQSGCGLIRRGNFFSSFYSAADGLNNRGLFYS